MEGDYFCQFGTNTSAITGSDTSTFPSSSSGWPLTSLRVATAPQFIEVPQSQVFPTAKTVRFECHAAGNPTPTIKWLKVIQSFLKPIKSSLHLTLYLPQ